MATTTSPAQTYDDVAEAESLFNMYASHRRIFVSYLNDDEVYSVQPMAVEELRQPWFRFTHEFWGIDLPTVQKQVADYNALLIGGTKRCMTAKKLFSACGHGLASKSPDTKDAVRAIASHLRGRRGNRCASNPGWLFFRLRKCYEWNDLLGMGDLLSSLEGVSSTLVQTGTGEKTQKWLNLLDLELSQQ